jgi:uracil-DNA glycosylase
MPSQPPSAGEPATARIPHLRTLPALREEAARCQACPLWKRATQTVFGEGAAHARVMLVGEQPGDQEDQQGRPFVGPAGGILDRGLAEAGIDRRRTYVTNAVKHFKWVPGEGRGKRRIHQKPSTLEVSACRPWLLAEIDLLRPDVVVCLGATAAQSLLGRGFKVTQQRGEILSSPFAAHVLATVHPSSILRARDDETRHREMRAFVADLKVVAAFLGARH